LIKKRRSIASVISVYAALPVIAVVIFLIVSTVSWELNIYLEERAKLIEQFNTMLANRSEVGGKSIEEISAIWRERTNAHRQEFIRGISIAGAFLILGIAVPIFATRYLVRRLERNLELLSQGLSCASLGNSGRALEGFDFEEFDQLTQVLKRISISRSDSEARWKRAEEELIAANSDLLKQAGELKQGRQIALSMMEDADKAREDLEGANARLNEAIEQARESARAADSANRAKSDFVATMSHEIRTPLNGIVGFIQLLNETSMSEEQEEFVSTIQSSGEALMAVINDILDFSKVESGSLTLESLEFSISSLIQELSAMFYPQAAAKGLSLNIDVDEAVPRQVKGDEARLRQILINLISNAIKFTEKGAVSLHVSLHSLSPEEEVAEVEFEVRDSGIGMSQEQMNQLFKPFSQGDSSTTRRYGGTGLGLAISKRLGEAMGGRVWAASRPHEGSSFFVQVPFSVVSTKGPDARMPVDEASILEARVETVLPAESLPLKIAIAEDNKANQRVIMIMLRRLGWECVFAENGYELIQLIKDQDYDLIFMDLQMPEMDGLETTRRIRAGEAGDSVRHAKIIALTANALVGDETKCLENGMDAYLSKPIKLDELRGAIAGLFEA
jgi:signal transduction histidine kinase/CheY-like chemotaxis protein